MLTLLALAAVPAVLLATAVTWVTVAASGHVYTVAGVPERPVALVLGAQVNPDGQPSDFLAARLELARQLYEAGKVRAILVSGDDGQPEYNEVDPMRDWLVHRGVPEKKVVKDHAGFDTRQSCVRAVKVFGVKSATVVTQGFHIDRAVALCREAGIDAVGVGDETMKKWPKPWYTGAARDKVACVKAMFEVVTGAQPAFLGRRETGVDEALAS